MQLKAATGYSTNYIDSSIGPSNIEGEEKNASTSATSIASPSHELHESPPLSTTMVQHCDFLENYDFLKHIPSAPNVPENVTCITKQQIDKVHNSFKKTIMILFL